MPGWDETPNEWRYRLKDPELFQKDSFRTKDISNGVYLVVGKLKNQDNMTAQSLRFKKSVFPTLNDAKAWKRDHWDKKNQSQIITGLSRVKNGKTQVLRTCNAELLVTDSDDRQQLSLSFDELKEKTDNGLLRLPRSTLIVGDGVYNNAWHPDDEFIKSYMSMDRQPFNINHSDEIQHEIGYWVDVDYKDKKLTGVPVLNLNTPYGRVALEHIRNRMYAGKPAELSVGFWCVEQEEHVEQLNKRITVVRDIEFDHCALVTRGACSPSAGAGVGLLRKNYDEIEKGDVNMTEIEEQTEDISTEVSEKTNDSLDYEKFKQEILENINNIAKELKEEQARIVDELRKKMNTNEEMKPTKLNLSREEARAGFKQLDRSIQEKAIRKAGLRWINNLAKHPEDDTILHWEEKYPYGL